MARGRNIPYSEVELAWIEAHRTWPRRKAHEAFCRRFGRNDVGFEAFRELCKRRGWLTGRTGRFEPGHVPSHGGVTQFRKGHRPHHSKPLGHEYVATDGYVMISVAETDPYTGSARRFVQKHRHLWQQVNGPVPKGHRLKCLDGNRANTDPANWMAAPRGQTAHPLQTQRPPQRRLELPRRPARQGGPQSQPELRCLRPPPCQALLTSAPRWDISTLQNQRHFNLVATVSHNRILHVVSSKLNVKDGEAWAQTPCFATYPRGGDHD